MDLTTVDSTFDSLCRYLSQKNTRASYAQYYLDDQDRPYLDPFGGIPFFRAGTEGDLPDRFYLDPAFIGGEAMERLGNYYTWFQSQAAKENTALWLRDLRARMERDGVWEGI